ncbi:MAG: hypothetical protein ACJ8GN_28980 [Longimicrobiaceae bacterium]
MPDPPLPFPTETELLAASGYPYLPLRVRDREPIAWHSLRDAEEVARDTYVGEDGEPRFECIRFHLPPDHPAVPGKASLWRRADGSGGWRWGLDDMELVPYRLPRVRAAAAAGERVFVVEGEKGVHALEAIGLTATCNPLGALQWTEVQAEALRGAEAVVIPGNDPPGKVHAARVMASLRGRARSAALLVLPGLERGEDVGDWLARGGGAAELRRLADAAPRDPSPGELASLLRLPPDVDPLTTSPAEVRALVAGADAVAAPAGPHPAFRRSAAAFARLGVALRPRSAVPDAGLPGPHATWRAVTSIVQDASEDMAAALEDASLLDRAVYELGLLSGLLRASMAGEPPARADGGDESDAAAFTTAPSVRLVRTRWDWEAFLGLGDAGLSAPPGNGAAYLLHLPPSGPLQMRRLHPLPAILLEVCARPQTRAEAAAAVADRVEGDPDRIAALARAQMDELAASGLLRRSAPASADEAVEEMLRTLAASAAPSGARSVLGMLSRGVRATREIAEDAAAAGDDPYPVHLLDVAVGAVEGALVQARLRDAFADALDGYWAGPDLQARTRPLLPLLDALACALGEGAHALPPIVLGA